MDRLRTFGIVAHIDAGKTTLTERILFDAGAQQWLGNVDDGTAAMDWMPTERSRGISITAAASRVIWSGHVLQVVDTPGHIDFVAEVERCLHVLDAVVVLLDGVRGVESQTESVWEQAARRDLPRLVFVNKLDRDGADFAAVVDEFGERLGCLPLPLVVPLRDESGRFAGLGDAVGGRVQWFEGRPTAAESARIAAELRQAHELVLDRVAACDDEVLADALAERRIAPERLLAVLRREFLAGRTVPVLGGSALWNRGVDWLLDAVVALFPSPRQLAHHGLWSTPGAGDPAAPFCGLVFKVQHVDRAWNYLRVVRGQLRPGDPWVRARGGVVARAEQLWVVQADRHENVDLAKPGEIVVMPGEYGLRTGDTIAAPPGAAPLPTPRFPAPVLAVVFEPERAEDRAVLAAALRDLAVDDPTLRVDVERDRLVVRGMGELHLEIVAELVRERTRLGFQVSKPRVDLRETIAAAGRGRAEVRALVAGQEVVAGCEVEVVPKPGASSPTVADQVGGALAQAPLAELRLLVAAGMRVGPLADVEIRLLAVWCAAAEPSAPLLELAARRALEEAFAVGGESVLEPWVSFELWCPESGVTPVLAELSARGGRVDLVSAGRLGARVVGQAPLARMLGFVTKLRSMTKGRGRVSMRPAGMQATK